MKGDGGRKSSMVTAPLDPLLSPYLHILESPREARSTGEHTPPSLCLCVSVVNLRLAPERPIAGRFSGYALKLNPNRAVNPDVF